MSSRLAALVFFINRHADCRAVAQAAGVDSEEGGARRNAAEKKISRAIRKVDGPDLVPKLQ